MVIGVSIVIPCLTSTKVMPFESRPRCLSPRIWCIGLQGVYRFQTVWSWLSVNSILRYLNFWNYQFFLSSLSTATHNWPKWFFHWPEPDYNWPVIFRTILSTSNMLHLHLLVSKLLTFSFKFNLQALTSTILAGSSSSRWIYSLPLVRRSFQLWVLWSSYLTPTHCDRPGTMNDAKKRQSTNARWLTLHLLPALSLFNTC